LPAIVKAAKPLLGAVISLVRRELIPLCRFNGILWNTEAVEVQVTERYKGFEVPLLCRLAVPVRRLLMILG
jgi:hypothetical protein